MKNRKDKDQLRKAKRIIKRSGNKKVRSAVKKDLATNPEDAHLTQVDYGGRKSRDMNGMDHDSTRREDARTKREYTRNGQLYNELDGGTMVPEPNDEQSDDEVPD